MFSIPTAALYHMSLPEDGWKVLGSPPYSGHCISVFRLVIRVEEVVLALSEIYQFKFRVLKQKQVRRLDVSMANASLLEVRTRTDERKKHWNEFWFFPKLVVLLPFPIEIFQIHVLVHVLSDYTESVGVVHSLGEIVAIKFNHIGVVLNLRQLNCFLFVFIKLV